MKLSEEHPREGARRIELERSVKAVASGPRLQILEWLKDPEVHFPPQRLGDPVTHGACNQFIADKLGVSQPTASRHLKILVDAGLIIGTPRSGWVFYRRDDTGLDELKRLLVEL